MKTYIRFTNASIFLFPEIKDNQVAKRKTDWWLNHSKLKVRRLKKKDGNPGYMYNLEDIKKIKEYLDERKHI